MPDFGSKEYWDERFVKDDQTFDWLLPAKSLCDAALDWIDAGTLKRAEILHIGCGTSDSSALRELVAEPPQIHNVDFSQAAIDAASSREKTEKEAPEPDSKEAEGPHGSTTQPGSVQRMRWSCLDLLTLNSTLELMEQQVDSGKLFDLVLDKSTSDSISCGAAVPLQLPYLLSINGWTRGILKSGVAQSTELHPLHVLAVHLAALTTPRTGKWIAISYSEERFPFLPPIPQATSHGFLPEGVIKAGFPHPNQLWKLETKEKIDVHQDETLAQRKKRLSSGFVHRPKISHWLYVLVRTDALVTY